METTVEELRSLYSEITDEDITTRRANKIASERQSLTDQIAHLEGLLKALPSEEVPAENDGAESTPEQTEPAA